MRLKDMFLEMKEKIWKKCNMKKCPGYIQKQTYSNILKILQPKKENFQIKNSDIFQIPAQYRWSGSNEYPICCF